MFFHVTDRSIIVRLFYQNPSYVYKQIDILRFLVLLDTKSRTGYNFKIFCQQT